MERMINYENELYIIETDNITKTLEKIKNKNYFVCLIFDLQNKSYYGFHSKNIDPEPMYPKKNQPITLTFGHKRDKSVSIVFDNRIKSIHVWTKKKMKHECIYASERRIFVNNISELII